MGDRGSRSSGDGTDGARGYGCWLQCSRGCPGHYSVFDSVYRCGKCGGLLDVQHDLEALRDRTAEKWIALFEARGRSSNLPYGSGVWGKLEWVLPLLDLAHIVTLGEGHTPLLRARRLEEDLGVRGVWIKQCGNSPTGSFKDLGMTVLVSVVRQMIAEGRGIRAVACASTGDTSAALGAYCAAAGIPAVVLLPQGKVSMAQLAQPVANGALVLALDTDFDGCMDIVEGLSADDTIYLANSLNPLRIEGQKTVGMEIVQQLGWEVPDWIIVPAGNLGNVTALGKGLLMMEDLGLIDRLPRLACAQAQRANPLYLSYLTQFEQYHPVEARQTLATAIQIGDPVSYERAVVTLRRFSGVVEQASEDELANAAAASDRMGFYCCPQTGTALAVLSKLAQRGEIKPGERVVVISTAHGLKFTDFKVAYHHGALEGVTAASVNPPVALPARLGVVSEAIDQALGTRS